jgi:hypothetical protein
MTPRISRRHFLIVTSAAVAGCPDSLAALPLIREAVEGRYCLVDEFGSHVTDEDGNRLTVKIRVVNHSCL